MRPNSAYHTHVYKCFTSCFTGKSWIRESETKTWLYHFIPWFSECFQEGHCFHWAEI